MKSYSTFFVGFLLVLAMASCKAKQVVQKSDVSEIKTSTDSVTVDMEDNLFIAYLPSGDVLPSSDTATINADSISGFQKAFSLLPRILSSSPQVKKGGLFVIHSKKSTKSNVNSLNNVSQMSNSVVEHKDTKGTKSICHNVLFWAIFLVFVCLVVRYGKKVSKIFGALK